MPGSLFSEELRRHCSAIGSIARVCHGTGINRQQFNKYLAGKAFPSTRNVRKISAFLGVSVEQLMSGLPGTPERPDGASSSSAGGAAGGERLLGAEAKLHVSRPQLETIAPERPANVLPLGYYDCYFPLHAASEMVVRWLISLRMNQGVLTFTCRANVRSMGCPRSAAARSKYHGLVFAGPREAHLVATSNIQLHQPTVIAVNTLPIAGRSYFSGIALTRRIDGPLAITAALRYRGNTLKVRKVLDEIGIISLSDADLDPVIAQLMRATPAAGANWMQSVNGRSLRTVSPSGGFGVSEANPRQRAAG